ncbi:MAG: nitroreductase family protein [Anaerolineae bacterium]|jgi:nitroreductase
MIRDLILRNRSYRRFYEDERIGEEMLRDLVDLARLSASGANRQPLKYILSTEREQNAALFDCLAWAGYLEDWAGPAPGERPAAYVVILGDTEISKLFGIDPGIAAQSILLGATEKGLGGCILASIQRDRLCQILSVEPRYEILYVLALGKPREVVVIESLPPDGSIRYWRDKQDMHHVPKRSLDDIILGS